MITIAATAGCISTGTTGLTIWVAGDCDLILHDTAPTLETDVFSATQQTVSLSAAINETVACQIVLRTENAAAGPFDLQVTNLTGPTGTLVAERCVTLHRAHTVRVEDFRSWYPDHAARPALVTDFPDILVPWTAPRGGGPLPLRRDRNEIVWADISVPPTTEPGVYAGHVRIFGPATAQPLREIAVTLTVMPVAIPAERSLPVVCRIDPRDLLREHLRWPNSGPEDTVILPSEPSHQEAIQLVNATMRLFHEHRTNPVLWASFPKYRPAADAGVDVNWEDYDALVGPWIDGSAYDDRVDASCWPLPISIDYPSAQRNGGVSSSRYAKALDGYLKACAAHFEERGWLERAILRPLPPTHLTTDAVTRVKRVAGIVQAAETDVPLVTHLPPSTLRTLGWHNAPLISLTGVGIWAPPACWHEPGAMNQQRGNGNLAWFMPDIPPYSGALAVEAPPEDQRTLPWQAYRYNSDGIWIEHAAEFNSQDSREALIYAGTNFGLKDQPVPSIRLKRLRRGLQDYELLKLLAGSGKQLLSHRVASRVVREAFTDACREHLLSLRPAGWMRDARTLRLARTVILQELSNTFEPTDAGTAQQTSNVAQWQVLLSQVEGIETEIVGVRLVDDEAGLRARLMTRVMNTTERSVAGSWSILEPPPGWELQASQPLSVPADSRRPSTLSLALEGLAYSRDGAYPFDVSFDTNRLGAFATQARLAVASVPFVDRAPRVDGKLSDWPIGVDNAAGDFRLCRGRQPATEALDPFNATLPTRVYFCTDAENFYAAIHCGMMPGERPLWSPDNIIPRDGIIPWGQDVVEVLLSPDNVTTGVPGDLYLLQVKPSGLVITRRGCPTDPPTGRVLPWNANARVAVGQDRGAWIVELAIPLSSLGKAARENRIWGLNVARLDARRGEYSSWSGARGHCYSPQSLGNVIFLRP